MFQVKCPQCDVVREVAARKPWMMGNSPYEKVCRPCSQKGKVKTEEHKKKLSESLKAIQTDELIEKKRQFMLTHPELWETLQPELGPQARIGTHHTDESKKAISEALTGKEVSQEVRKQISETMKAKNEETNES